MARLVLQGTLDTKEEQELVQGAKEAAKVVTRRVADGQWDKLEGLVEKRCLKGLKQLVGVMKEEREMVVLEPKDVFLEFVDRNENQNSFTLVTFSFPGLHDLRIAHDDYDFNKKNLKHQNFDSKDDFIESMKASRRLKEIFESTEIVIGNYEMSQDHDDWIVSLVGQTSTSIGPLAPFFR